MALCGSLPMKKLCHHHAVSLSASEGERSREKTRKMGLVAALLRQDMADANGGAWFWHQVGLESKWLVGVLFHSPSAMETEPGVEVLLL
jgi:hypothetical protein